MRSNACLYSILLIAVIMLSCACEQSRKKQDLSTTDFIYLQNGVLKLHDTTFLAIMLNYVVEFQYIDGEFILSPNKTYENPELHEGENQSEVFEQFRSHFQLIREMGFNTLRICFDRVSESEDGRVFFRAGGDKLFIDSDEDIIFANLDSIISIASEENLRVMFLIKPPIENCHLEGFTAKLLHRFSNNPTLFAYDFFNEPLYFDKKEVRKKKDAVKIVSRWRKLMDKYAPDQLMTLGFSEPIEVFEWDAEILPVDFLSFHTYHPLRISAETYWYSTYISKPFMIGETALPADNDSITYEEQRLYMRETYQYARDCGAIGFGWWEFQESVTDHFEAQKTGLLNHYGITYTKDSNHTIIGTVKPAAKEVKYFMDYQPKAKAKPINYYNMLGYNNIVIKGRILDKSTNEPVEGAVIRGWNEYYAIGQNTFTDENGYFMLYSNDECVHFEISAPGMSRSKFSQKLENYQPQTKEYLSMNNLPNQKLEYHKINYISYLSNKNLPDSTTQSPYILSFDSTLFNKTKFIGILPTVYLEKIK